MMKFSHRIEPVISIWKVINTRNYRLILLIWWKNCWKRIQRIEFILNKPWLILTSRKCPKKRVMQTHQQTTIHNLTLHCSLLKTQRENNSIRKTVVLISSWVRKISWMAKHNPSVVQFTPNLVELILKDLNLHQWLVNLHKKSDQAERLTNQTYMSDFHTKYSFLLFCLFIYELWLINYLDSYSLNILSIKREICIKWM